MNDNFTVKDVFSDWFSKIKSSYKPLLKAGVIVGLINSIVITSLSYVLLAPVFSYITTALIEKNAFEFAPGQLIIETILLILNNQQVLFRIILATISITLFYAVISSYFTCWLANLWSKKKFDPRKHFSSTLKTKLLITIINFTLFFVPIIMIFLSLVNKLAEEKGTQLLQGNFFFSASAVMIYFILIITGIIISVFILLSTYLSALDNKSSLNAVKESFNLIKGNWWRTLGYIILIIVILQPINMIGELFSNLFESAIISTVISYAGYMIIYAFESIFLLEYLKHLKKTKKALSK